MSNPFVQSKLASSKVSKPRRFVARIRKGGTKMKGMAGLDLRVDPTCAALGLGEPQQP